MQFTFFVKVSNNFLSIILKYPGKAIVIRNVDFLKFVVKYNARNTFHEVTPVLNSYLFFSQKFRIGPVVHEIRTIFILVS